jgi:uncharacterized membrane protein
MDPAHLHLLLNHLPIVGLAFAVLSLIVSLALNNASMRRLSYILFVAVALTAIPAFLSGEPAEERIESIAPDAELQMETHEEQGEIALWTSIAVGLLALIVLFVEVRKYQYAKTLALVLLLAGLGNLAFMYRVGNSGGEIRHTEIRSGASSTPVLDNQQNTSNENEDDD